MRGGWVYHALVNVDGSVRSCQRVEDREVDTVHLLTQQDTLTELETPADILRAPIGSFEVDGQKYAYAWSYHEEGPALRVYLYRDNQLVVSSLIMAGIAREKELGALRAFDKHIRDNCRRFSLIVKRDLFQVPQRPLLVSLVNSECDLEATAIENLLVFGQSVAEEFVKRANSAPESDRAARWVG
jgi:hypothetical protein